MNHGREVVLPDVNSSHTFNGTNSNVTTTGTVVANNSNDATKSSHNSGELPQTGNEAASLTLLGAMAAMLGLGVLSKKREY